MLLLFFFFFFLLSHHLCSSGLIEAQKDILGVDDGDDAVEVDGAAEAGVDPEEGGEVARVGEPARFKQDVVEGAAAGDEGFDGGEAGVSVGGRGGLVGSEMLGEW